MLILKLVLTPALISAATLVGRRYATVLAVFSHRAVGPEGASQVMRGLVVGLFGFAAFFLAIALTLESLGIAAAFALATLAVLAVAGPVAGASAAGGGTP